MRRLLAAVLLVGIVAAPRVMAGPVLTKSFTHVADPKGRDYWLYVPTHARGAHLPLVVYLHGCTQTGEDAAVGTGWNDFAEAHGIVVVYPEQRVDNGTDAMNVDGNGIACWNWFREQDQERSGGEPQKIMSIVDRLVDTRLIDTSRVYVMGASAGADMATILGVTYSDRIAAVVPVAGCAYKTCTDVDGTVSAGLMEHVVPSFVVQATTDELNVFPLGETAVQQWVGANHAHDPELATSPQREMADPELGGTPGHVCDAYHNYPCLGPLIGMQRYPVTKDRYLSGTCALVEAWYVHGAGHAYLGGQDGSDDTTFTDPSGPNLTPAAWTFMSHHRLGVPCAA